MAERKMVEMAELIEKMSGNIEKMAQRGNQPIYLHPDGNGYSTIVEDDAPQVVARSARGIEKGAGSRLYLPKGYKHRSVYKSFGEMLNDGMRSRGQAVRQRYEAAADNLELLPGWSIRKNVQGMSEGIGTDGGFTVLPEFSQKIFEKVYDNSLWEQTDNYSCAGNTMTFPRNAETSRKDGQRAGGILGYWVQEGMTIPPSKPTIAGLTLKLKKVAVVIYLTDELIEDAGSALESYVVRKAGEEFKFLIGNALINGLGNGAPLGILKSNALLTIPKETGQATQTIVTQNILKMWMRMNAASRANASWYINQDTEAQLYQMSLGVGTGGQVVYMPPGGLSGAPYATLMGRPVVPLEFCQTLGTTGDIILADMKQYVSLSKGGITQAQSVHVEFLTDQTALRFTMRVDGEPWENSPVTPYNGTNTQSSFIALASR